MRRLATGEDAGEPTNLLRLGRVLCTEPNTNVIAPRAMVPLLVGESPPGEHWLLGAFWGETAGLEGLPTDEPPFDRAVPCFALIDGGELQVHVGDEALRYRIGDPGAPDS
ncbi:MAG: hypothetical protein FJ104_04690 [Deltaproteobacteria bacterium]|nr:hypothetical protein [Deltaproteobacteria bacterium]